MFVKPRLGTPINRGHPFGDVEAYWPLNEGAGPPRCLLLKGALPEPALVGSVTWGSSFLGRGLSFPLATGDAEVRYDGAGITYSLPSAAGSIVVDTMANFSPTDGLEHSLFYAKANSFVAGPGVHLIKYSDNNWYVGWFAGVDDRMTLAASGLWTSGERVQFALTWNTALNPAQIFYVNAVQKVTKAAITTGNTASGGAANRIRLGDSGDSDGTEWRWTGHLGWVGIWPRMLSTADLVKLYLKPYDLFAMPLQPSVRRMAGGAGKRWWYYAQQMAR
jgi:hypothetical protein